jgi:hypothetical protein
MWWYQLLSMVYHKSSKTHCYMYLVSADYPVRCERKHQWKPTQLGPYEVEDMIQCLKGENCINALVTVAI